MFLLYQTLNIAQGMPIGQVFPETCPIFVQHPYAGHSTDALRVTFCERTLNSYPGRIGH